jgi:hypothetical protein
MHGLVEMLEKRKEKSRRGAGRFPGVKTAQAGESAQGRVPRDSWMVALRALVPVFSQPHLVHKKKKSIRG